MHEMHTGLKPDVDSATQRRFDDGHRFEGLARPLAEAIIGEELYPVTGTNGRLSASFDGLTMAEVLALEHKSLNDELRAAMPAPGLNEGVTLPLQYRVQMEQQCMVSGADRVLFMASKWVRNHDVPEDHPDAYTLVEERHCWYESSQHLADDIAAGWDQFDKDLCAYVPAEPAAPKPQATAREALPALVIEAKGEVTAGNLDEYKANALAVLATIPGKPATDLEFINAKQDATFCRDVQESMAQAKTFVLGRMTTIDEAIKAIDHIAESYRRKAIDLETAVEAEEKRRKQQMVIDAGNTLRAHVEALNARIGKPYMPVTTADFAGAIKSKRTVASMQDAIDYTLANAKIAANATADRIDANLKHLATEAADHSALFPDVASLVLKQQDDFEALVQFRVADFKAKEAAKVAPAPAEVAAAPAPTPAPSVTALPAARQAAVVAHQDDISRFLASRTWGKGEETRARAILVEYEKFRAPALKAA
ncbi:hypothetical protein J7E62_27460 [Variovorax paradoxus]|nr:hypothetical protein [Variovorax paradoxus]